MRGVGFFVGVMIGLLVVAFEKQSQSSIECVRLSRSVKSY